MPTTVTTSRQAGPEALGARTAEDRPAIFAGMAAPRRNVAGAPRPRDVPPRRTGPDGPAAKGLPPLACDRAAGAPAHPDVARDMGATIHDAMISPSSTHGYADLPAMIAGSNDQARRHSLARQKAAVEVMANVLHTGGGGTGESEELAADRDHTLCLIRQHAMTGHQLLVAATYIMRHPVHDARMPVSATDYKSYLFYGGMITAQKFLYDDSYRNVSHAKLSGMPLKYINDLEVKFLKSIKYEVNIGYKYSFNTVSFEQIKEFFHAFWFESLDGHRSAPARRLGDRSR